MGSKKADKPTSLEEMILQDIEPDKPLPTDSLPASEPGSKEKESDPYQRLGLAPEDMTLLQDAGIDPDDAAAYLRAGIGASAMLRLFDTGVYPSDALSYLKVGITAHGDAP